MGELMASFDAFIPSFLAQLNLRFSPSQRDETAAWAGGIEEMVALQREFEIFRKDRSFAASAALLNLGSSGERTATQRWYILLEKLKDYPSNIEGENGDVAIVRMLISNFETKKPMPVFFKAHHSGEGSDDEMKRVIVGTEGKPTFYLDQDYITVSLPMKPRRTGRAARSSRPRKK